MIRLSTIAILIFFSISANAGQIKGGGGMTCGSWIKERETNNHYVKLSWIQGFLSAYNQYSYTGNNPNGIFGSTDANSLTVWMDNYCRNNPLEEVYSGTLILIEELKSKAK
jgi:hypothetical protein